MKLKPTITARVIEDSISPAGDRIITLQLRYPRIIHAEQLTHRNQNRNAGSSRAIPTKKMLAQIFNDPAMPTEWGSNRPGMQAGDALTGWRLFGVRSLWSIAAKFAAVMSWGMMKLGAHKQIANRVTEPYQYMNTLITASLESWHAYFDLRAHPDADPTIRDLAIENLTAIEMSTPMPLGFDEWHLPYVTQKERAELPLAMQLKLSTARCARVSFEPFDGNAAHEKEVERHNLLVGSRPVHASPTEHQARPMQGMEAQYGNLKGWRQYRYQVEADAAARDRAEGRKTDWLRRTLTPEDHKRRNQRKLEVQALMQQRMLKDLGTAELPIKTSFARGGVVQKPVGGLALTRNNSEYVVPKSSGLDPLTSDGIVGSGFRGGYPYPLEPTEPLPLSSVHDWVDPKEHTKRVDTPFNLADHASPSTDSGSASSGDSGGSSND